MRKNSPIIRNEATIPSIIPRYGLGKMCVNKQII